MEDAQRPRRVTARLLEWLAEQDGSRAMTGLAMAPATPIERLAERLGLDVATFHPSGPRAATLGWLEPDENLIYLRADLSETARRFTLAHEIGHALLHRPGGLARLIATGTLEPPEVGSSADLAACDAADFDAPPELFAGGDETLSPSQAYSARARRESEANAFASCLLLPEDRLLSAYLRTRGTGLTHLRRLAGDFGVSEEVLLRRLVGLLAPVPIPAPGPEQEAPDAADTRDETRADASASLDASQRAAAQTPAPALVVAGPGTGKTSTLVARVANLVREQGVGASHILALTFSNKAAREMRERLERLLLAPAAELDTGLPAQEMPTVSTIHAFCGDLLRRYAPLVGLRPDFRLITETDGYLLLRALAPSLALDYYQPLAAPALHFPALLRAISRAKDELAGPREYAAAATELRAEAETPEQTEAAERAEEVARVYAAYQAALDARGDADFGDVVRLAVRLLREHPDVLAEVQAEHEHVLVDEFQDINRAMGVLLRTLTAGRESLWAVGDANQAIYRFRGASPANLALFGSEYPGAHLHTLRRNYRSVPAVLEASHGFARYALHAGDEAALEAARVDCGGAGDGESNGVGARRQAITLAVAPDEAQELAGLARAIHEREQAGHPLTDQVVLCRTRRQCQRVAAALADAGIRTQLATPLLDEPDVKDLLAVLTLAADRSGMGLLRAGNITDHAYSPAEAQIVLRVARERHTTPLALLAGDLAGVPDLSVRSRRALKRLAATVARMRQAPDTVTGLARYLFGQTGIGRRLLAGLAAGDARAAAKAGHAAQVLALAQGYEDQRRATLTAEPAAIHGAAWAGLLDYVRVVSVTRGEGAGAQEAPGPAEGVRVMTVHASKGLEFPVVYLPGLADRRFPLQRRAQPAPLPPGLAEGMPAEEDTHLAEEACLFFVALTRARDELVLSAADRYGRTRYSLSPFVPPLIARLGAHLRRTAWTAHHDDGGELRLVSPEPVMRRASPRTRLPVAEAPAEGPLHAGEIETYSRCPRQYAYRYVYGLHPREVGLPALRHALHETLTAVRERTAAGSPATLGDALALFDEHWQRELGASAETATEGAAEREQARELYGDIYRRHGRAVLERLLAPSSATEAAAADSARAEVKAGATGEAVSYDQPVLIHVGVREIEVTLDRVEAPREALVAANGNAGGEGVDGAGAQVRRRAGETAEPVRFVRHRMGRGNGSPADLRTLLYVLAAEQQSHAAPQVVQHNLTTGELEPVPLDGRRLARLRDDLGNLLAGIESGNYPARPDPNTCQGCPFLLICPA
ncbi:MAG TPA: UvrD-helicase domain-containing protein [Ktedonobacterales bacterium]